MNRVLRIIVCMAALATTAVVAVHADCDGCARERRRDALDDIGRSTSAGGLIGLSVGMGGGCPRVAPRRPDVAPDGSTRWPLVGARW